MMNTRLVSWGAAGWAVLWAIGSGPVRPLAAQTPAEVAALVAQLGDRSFAVRQRASRQLERFGSAGEAELRKALEHGDAEVRRRAGQVLARVLAADLDSRLAAFVRDVDGSRRHELPAWEAYRQAIGQDRAARELFVQMQRSEPGLLAALQLGPRQAGDALHARCLELVQVAPETGEAESPTLGTVACLLLVGGDPAVAVDEQLATQTYRFIYQACELGLRDAEQAPAVRALLGRWVRREVGQEASYQHLFLAASFNLPEGLDVARRWVTKDGVPPHMRQYAILVIGRFGQADDLPRIVPLLHDTAVCAAQVTNKRQVQTQVRDVALAVAVRLSGQQLRDYGFNRALEHDRFLYATATLGFADPAERDAALKKWADWSAAQPR
jgi:hypothetical protein